MEHPKEMEANFNLVKDLVEVKQEGFNSENNRDLYPNFHLSISSLPHVKDKIKLEDRISLDNASELNTIKTELNYESEEWEESNRKKYLIENVEIIEDSNVKTNLTIPVNNIRIKPWPFSKHDSENSEVFGDIKREISLEPTVLMDLKLDTPSKKQKYRTGLSNSTDELNEKICKPLEVNACGIKNSNNKHTCEICFKVYSRLSQLKVHLSNHTGEKPFKCKFCLKPFPKAYLLRAHVKTHTSEKLFKCEICLRSFSQASNLKTHIKTHTGEKPHKCEICLKLFARSFHLKLHIKTHTGEKPFKCGVCLKSFLYSSNFKIHNKIHTGEKPLKCEICSKSFLHLSGLNSHIRIHTGEKPYECELCSKSFSQSSHLKTHIKIHTREKLHKS